MQPGVCNYSKMRLFWAINLPEDLKKKLYHFAKDLSNEIPVSLKLVEENNIHLTLKFLGDVEPGQVNLIKENVKKAVNNIKPFIIKVKGFGCFPNKRYPRVFWTGIYDEAGQLQKLYREIEQAHVALGFSAEKRSYSPHLTLARFRTDKNTKVFMSKALERAGSMKEIGSFRAVSIELMHSTLTPRGALYRVLDSISL